jgi:hypothetical protein
MGVRVAFIFLIPLCFAIGRISACPRKHRQPVLTTTTSTTTTATIYAPSPNPDCGKIVISPSISGDALNGRIVNGDTSVGKSFILSIWAKNKIKGILTLKKNLNYKENSWAWTVQVYYLQSPSVIVFVCGGALIDVNYVVTAASCLFQPSLLPYSVIFISIGTNNLTQSVSDTTFYGLSNYTINANYSSSPGSNNIALLRLNQTVDILPDAINTICVPVNVLSSSIYNKNVILTGW